MIILAGTPIGNDADASARLREVLERADLIAAEDTRRLLNLAGRLGVRLHAPVVAYHDHNEVRKAPDILEVARTKTVVVVSDAGMPAISDPGYSLVAQAVAEGVAVTAVPGPSAVLTAITLSGLPCDRFTFEGFLPRKTGELHAALVRLALEARTMVFFESPRRLGATLSAMSEVFGSQRRAVVARELTKVHEDVVRGTLAELSQWTCGGILGEIVIVVSGYENSANRSIDPVWVQEVNQLRDAGLKLKAAAGHVARREHVSVRDLYAAVVEQPAVE